VAVYAFLGRCGWETGSGAGRGEVEYFDGVFKAAVYSGGRGGGRGIKKGGGRYICAVCQGVGCNLTFAVVDYSVGCAELWSAYL